MKPLNNLLRGQSAVLRVGYGHCSAVSHWLRKYEPSPQLRCHSRLVYLPDMPRRSLRGALHIDLLATVLGGFK